MNVHVSHARTAPAASYIERVVEETNGDMKEAEKRLMDIVRRGGPALQEELWLDGIRARLSAHIICVRRAQEMVLTETRGRPFNSAPFRMNEATKRAQQRLRNSGVHIARSWLDTKYTIGGHAKALRDFTGTEVLAHGEKLLAQGNTMVRNARFLIAVGAAAGIKRIGDALDVSTVNRLKEASEKPVN